MTIVHVLKSDCGYYNSVRAFGIAFLSIIERIALLPCGALEDNVCGCLLGGHLQKLRSKLIFKFNIILIIFI